MKRKYIVLLIVLLMILIILIPVLIFNKENNSQLANPSAVKCINEGHEYEIRTGEGGQYGVCIFSNNTECDAWDYFRGEC